jgi:hypothetical protein
MAQCNRSAILGTCKNWQRKMLQRPADWVGALGLTSGLAGAMTCMDEVVCQLSRFVRELAPAIHNDAIWLAREIGHAPVLHKAIFASRS